MKHTHFSKIGFILAAAGSAVGLGNIWKFPYIAGEYGGGAFVLVYLLTVILIGLPLLMAEITIGSITQKEPVTAFEKLSPNTKKYWKYGGFAFISGFLILTFYTVVIGWIFYYIYLMITAMPNNAVEAENMFNNMLHHDITTQLFFLTFTIVIVAYIVSKGVAKGIQQFNLVLMPFLMAIILGMFFYSMSFDAFGTAVHFMFAPDFSKLTPTAILVAVGHAFFTLSLGMAAIMTYASFADDNTRVLRSSIWIVILDTGIALIAGLMMFTFIFHFGMEPGKGPGLVFISLPAVFTQMGFIGQLFAVLFFMALASAGLTSAVSLLEPTIAYLHQRLGVARNKAVWGTSLAIYLIGVVALLSNIEGFQFLAIGEQSVFDYIDFFTAAIMLPVAGLITAIFIGYVSDKNHIFMFLKEQNWTQTHFNIWIFSLKIFVPIGAVLVMLTSLDFI